MVVSITLALLPHDGFHQTRTYITSTSAEGQGRAWQEQCELLARHCRKSTDLAMLAFHLGGEPAGAASFSTAMEQVVAVVRETDPLQAWLQLPRQSRMGSLECSSAVAGVKLWHIVVSTTYSPKVERANRRKAASQPGSTSTKPNDRTIERRVLGLMWPAYHGQLQTSANTAQLKNGMTPLAAKLLLYMATGMVIAVKLSRGADVLEFEEQLQRLHETKRNANNNVARTKARATKDRKHAANIVNGNQVLLEIDRLLKALTNIKGFMLPDNVEENLPIGSIVPYAEVFHAVLPFWNAKLCMTGCSDKAERVEEARKAMRIALTRIDTEAVQV